MNEPTMSEVFTVLLALPEKLDALTAQLARIQAIAEDGEKKIAVSCKEAAKLGDVSETTLREWARCGYVPNYRVGSCTKISRRALSEWAYEQSINRTEIKKGEPA